MVALLGPLPAWAQPPAPPPAPVEAKKPVRVGPTTVTVIDEQESVDDIISRVKRARQERAAGPAPAATPPVDPPGAREKVKNKVRERAATRKELRERAQRLRENLRERRANRLRRAE
jgi:hypothetical protein